MIRYFEKEGMDILLAAPTGRAAKRMTEATGYEARTIHRMLELNGALTDERKSVNFERNEENPLEADVIIIDEMSMVDIHLFQSLLKAVCVGTRLIMVGDVDQLPSVGPGQILRDLIASRQFPVVILQKIFRQAGESDIVINAHRINHGEAIKLDNKSKDFFFLERKDVNVIYKHMVQLVSDKIPRTNKTRPINEIIAPVMSKSFLDSVGVKLGILLCSTKIKITPINSHANPYLQLKNVVMTPPKSGPIAAATAPITPTIAKATVRFSPEYVPLIMEMVAGSINAPAIPSITDHPINTLKHLNLLPQ